MNGGGEAKGERDSSGTKVVWTSIDLPPPNHPPVPVFVPQNAFPFPDRSLRVFGRMMEDDAEDLVARFVELDDVDGAVRVDTEDDSKMESLSPFVLAVDEGGERAGREAEP